MSALNKGIVFVDNGNIFQLEKRGQSALQIPVVGVEDFLWKVLRVWPETFNTLAGKP